MNIKQVKVGDVEEGDIIQPAPDSVHRSLVVDIHENAAMNGVWLEYADYSSRFFEYDEMVYRVTFG